MGYWYPSSVNRGYFSYAQCGQTVNRQVFRIHPLSIEAISPTSGGGPLGRHEFEWYPSSVNRGYFSYHRWRCGRKLRPRVSILCQSRLFLLPVNRDAVTAGECLVSILCQSRLFLLRGVVRLVPQQAVCIHPLSIEAISPTGASIAPVGETKKYPSSVNRGYFSYVLHVLAPHRNALRIHPLSIEAISPTLVSVSIGKEDIYSIHPLSIEAISPTTDANRHADAVRRIHPLSIEAISPTEGTATVMRGTTV